MQVFIPYASPIKTAMALKNDRLRFPKQIIEARQILAAIYDPSRGYANHPVTKMYKNHSAWLNLYLQTLELVRDKNLFLARIRSQQADQIRPEWMTDELCDQHKRRLYTKNKLRFAQWADLGESWENWYIVDGLLVKYLNGRKINL